MGYLGIDLGTTNSVAVIYNDKTNGMDIVKIDRTDEILPSVVSYLEEGVIVGAEAKSGAIIYPEQTITSVKRLIGQSEPISAGSQDKLPEEVSADILRKLKQAAADQSGETYDEVVITHPAYFNDRQIFATKQAGLMAGFRSVQLLSEPLAAAIEYGYRHGYAQTLMVYDLGGGTLDVCVLKVSQDEQGQEIFQELSDVGDMNLGGDDFDSELIRWMIEIFTNETGIDLSKLCEICNLVAEIAKVPIPGKKPIVGSCLTQVESGLVSDIVYRMQKLGVETGMAPFTQKLVGGQPQQ